jgi:hypothetical protein
MIEMDDEYWRGWDLSLRERLVADAKTRIYENPDASWAEEDEPRYVMALLHAGEEPGDASDRLHSAWQLRAASILMHKYRNHWWWHYAVNNVVHPDPQYRKKAIKTHRDIQLDELRKFYTWVCKQRREPWTNRLVPESR